jgi:hypothetical protein
MPIPFPYTMNVLNKWFFAVPSQFNGILDLSRVPKTATIFYHENRWWYELKTGQRYLRQRESIFNELKKSTDCLKFAEGPFGKNFSPSSYSF